MSVREDGSCMSRAEAEEPAPHTFLRHNPHANLLWRLQTRFAASNPNLKQHKVHGIHSHTYGLPTKAHKIGSLHGPQALSGLTDTGS